MLKANSCRRCGGATYNEEQLHGPDDWVCIQCGSRQVMLEPDSPHYFMHYDPQGGYRDYKEMPPAPAPTSDSLTQVSDWMPKGLHLGIAHHLFYLDRRRK